MAPTTPASRSEGGPCRIRAASPAQGAHGQRLRFGTRPHGLPAYSYIRLLRRMVRIFDRAATCDACLSASCLLHPVRIYALFTFIQRRVNELCWQSSQGQLVRIRARYASSATRAGASWVGIGRGVASVGADWAATQSETTGGNLVQRYRQWQMPPRGTCHVDSSLLQTPAWRRDDLSSKRDRPFRCAKSYTMDYLRT